MAVLAVLGIVIALGGTIRVFAADRTVDAEASLDVRIWQSLSDHALYLSTRPPGGAWTTHDAVFRMRPIRVGGDFVLSDAATRSVPVAVELPAPDPSPVETAEPTVVAEGQPTGPASCCTVRGMSDSPAARRAVAREMRDIIAFAREHFGFTHRGGVTINIAHTAGGLLLRYEEAFGESIPALPSECSFQRGEHIFLGPSCRSDQGIIASEWIRRATDAAYVSPRWASVAMVDYYLTYYLEGSPPTLRDDQVRRVLFYEHASDLRAGRASDDMTLAAMLYAIRAYGSTEDWLDFYEGIRGGREESVAFEAAFGVPLTRFHADFEEWAAGQNEILHVTASGSCLEASRHITPRSPSEGGGFADYRVPLEWDDDGDGYVCERYAALPEETLACVVVGAEPGDGGGGGQ